MEGAKRLKPLLYAEEYLEPSMGGTENITTFCTFLYRSAGALYDGSEHNMGFIHSASLRSFHPCLCCNAPMELTRRMPADLFCMGLRGFPRIFLKTIGFHSNLLGKRITRPSRSKTRINP